MQGNYSSPASYGARTLQYRLTEVSPDLFSNKGGKEHSIESSSHKALAQFSISNVGNVQ